MTAQDAKALLLPKQGKGPLSKENAISSGSTLLNLACTENPDLCYIKGAYYYVVGDSTSGKSQPLSAKILTPDGWILMGDAKVGQVVIDPDGGLAEIDGVFPQGRLPVYEVGFSDDATVLCSGDHLWMAYTFNNLKRGDRKVQTTKELMDWIKGGYVNCRRKYVPITKPVEFSRQAALPIDPYVLGCLIGDGCLCATTVRITLTEPEIIANIAKSLPCSIRLVHSQGLEYEFRSPKIGMRNFFKQTLLDLGLRGKKSAFKFIPHIYLQASIGSRWGLLQGLMDTDGFACKQGGVSFSTVSPRLVEDVSALVRSLGGVVTTHSRFTQYTHKGEKRTGQKSYTLSIRIPNRKEVFRLTRKRDRVLSDGHVNRHIKSIRPVGKKECQCISVTSKRNLYLTDHFVPTHNTWIAHSCFAEACLNPAFRDYELIYDNVEGGALMDIEFYFGKETKRRVRSPGRDKDGSPLSSQTIEDFYYYLFDLVKKGKKFIYWLDSQDALDSKAAEKKFSAQRKAAEDGEKAAGSYGDGKAKFHSEHLRHVLAGVRRSQSILFMIGQTRDNLGFGFEKKTRSGGKALRFYANLEIWTSVGGQLKKLVRGDKRTIGVECLAEVKKNRITGKVGKDRSVSIPIYYRHGIDDIGSCVSYLIAEKHWHPTGKGIFNAKELGIEGSKSVIISQIERNGLEGKLRALVAQVWEEIEKECEVKRKRRYV